MCGISCVVTLKGHSPASRHKEAKSSDEADALERKRLGRELEESLEVIKHRGPDGRGYWISENCRVALGHVRLSILDLSSNAQQPFHDAEGDIHVVVTGEFYDWEDIRTDLESKGYQFQSQCDSEIIIALYKEYGMSMMSHLRGEFAFCLYDSKAQYFVAARDRYGVKPLFYTVHDGQLLIASEMKAFLPFGWQPEWDVQSVIEAGYLSDRRTMFSGVQKILPGHYLSVQSGTTFNEQEYWDMDYRDKHEVETRTEEEMILGVRGRFIDAVRVRLRADVPVGIFLSGGLDSSATAGVIKHLLINEKVELGNSKTDLINAYSIKFMGEEFDEEPIAQRTSEWLGIKKHVVYMTEERFVEHYEEAAWHCEVSVFDLGFIGKLALSKLTRETGVKVILTGEGSDEHFAGYYPLLVDFVREPDYAWPQTGLPEEVRQQRLYEEEHGQEWNGNQLANIKPDETPGAARAKRQINNVNMISITDFMNFNTQISDWVREEHGHQDPRIVATHVGLNGRTRRLISTSWHPLHSALYIWSRIALANVLLVALGDRVEMSHSIEGRQPFLDHHLTEYVNNLPPSMKLKWDPETKSFKEKWILKEAAKPFITEELYKRRKHPFSASAKYEVGGMFHKYLASVLTKENVDNLGFLSWDKCKDLLEDSFEKGDAGGMRKVFMITQLIVMGKRFGFKKAAPEFTSLRENGPIPAQARL